MPSNAQHRDFSKLCPLIGVFQAIPSVQLDNNVGSPTTFPLTYPIDRYTAMTPSYALCGVCLWVEKLIAHPARSPVLSRKVMRLHYDWCHTALANYRYTKKLGGSDGYRILTKWARR